jgi:hypothetical protein
MSYNEGQIGRYRVGEDLQLRNPLGMENITDRHCDRNICSSSNLWLGCHDNNGGFSQKSRSKTKYYYIQILLRPINC